MKNKNVLIISIVKNIMILVALLFIFTRNSGIAQIPIIPFITCVFLAIGKDFCLLINKPKYATIFQCLFVISFLTFWFGFLILFSYFSIREKNYLFFLFTVPFWIAGIFIARKYLFRSKQPILIKRRLSNSLFKTLVSGFLVSVILLIGIVCLFIGIKDTYQLNKRTHEYVKATGYLTHYEIYDSSDQDITYRLIYIYEVNGIRYTVSTDYGVTSIPEKNSIREVNYNPSNPKESVLVGANSKNMLIYFGAFFTLGAITFILGALSMKGFFDKIKIDVIGFYFGFVFLIVGIGFLFLQKGMSSSWLEMVKSLGIWILLPILFILVGIFQMIRCLFFRKLSSTNK